MKLVRPLPLCAVALACSTVQPALADSPPVILPGSVNMFVDDRGANDLGLVEGNRFQYGADIVGGSDGVTIQATASTGFATKTAPCVALAVDAGFCAQTSPYNSGRLDPWTLVFERGTATTTVVTPSLVGAPAVPFPTSVTLSGHGVTPTISWKVPGGLVPDGFRVQVYDKGHRLSNGQADLIFSTNLTPSATSYQLPGSIGLSSAGSYAIVFQLIETHGHMPVGGNETILSRSDSYFDFTPLTGSAPTDVALPTIDSTGVYHFTVGGVDADHITFIDPAVATGYSYATGAGDPNFLSVLLPDVGDGEFTLDYSDGTGAHSVSVAHDVQYFFGNGGVSAFTVTGIETSAGVDPSNGTGFVTGLTFAAAGDFTGTMVPIVAEVTAAVPEPSRGLLLLAGLGLFGAVGARRRNFGR